MPSHYTRWCIAVSWMTLALCLFVVANVWSGPSLVLLAIGGLVPPLVMLTLWSDGPPLTIAEVIRSVERP